MIVYVVLERDLDPYAGFWLIDVFSDLTLAEQCRTKKDDYRVIVTKQLNGDKDV